ncbi:hypothetical protein ACJMK2_001612 [Sinanodonta woodiana]|uniref:Uncharacterized protein n=1 Tax=Sinanodonta woodiana TaxID=1069815 RepID=A0ABD3XSU8_SINWO
MHFQCSNGCQVNIHMKRRSKGIQCSLDIHTDSEMKNKINTFDEPYRDRNDDAHDIEDEYSMIRESDDSSYKPDESDPMD